MAAAAAAYFNTSASSASASDLPSIFQLIASDGLSKAVRPAVEQVLKFCASRHPDRLGFLHRYCDEIHLLLDLLLQHHHLQLHNALFAEKFYGLERAADGSKKGFELSVACGVLVPYVKAKLDGIFETLREQEADGVNYRRQTLNASRSYFLAIYPYVHLLHEGSVLAFYLSYALGKSKHHVPWTKLAGVHLRYGNPDLETGADHDESGPVERALRVGANALAEGITAGLEVGAFFMQFLQWWYSSDGHALDLTSLPVPSPPESDPATSKTKCPICRGARRNETLLPTSGYVFCYACIVKHLRTQESCPVTNYPAKEEQLVRIYSQ